MSEAALRILLVAVGGAAGSVCRYLCSGYVARGVATLTGGGLGTGAAALDYPWGTTVVNLVGSLLFGVIWAAFGREGSTLWKVFLLGGFLGAFTTFSTFMFETVHLLDKGRPLAALANLLLQNVAGVILVFIGLALGSALCGRWGHTT